MPVEMRGEAGVRVRITGAWGPEELGVGGTETKGDEAVPGASSSHFLGTPPSPGMFGLLITGMACVLEEHLLMWGVDLPYTLHAFSLVSIVHLQMNFLFLYHTHTENYAHYKDRAQ